jgi:hypothetical protein
MSGEAKASRLALIGAVSAGLVAGAVSGWLTLRQGMVQGDDYAGWNGSSVTGSVDADPWTRARVAISGLLALNKSQAIYLSRNTDDSGERLRQDCRYRVSGGVLPARWWSITVYAADNYLPLNDDDALSFDQTEAQPDGKAAWSGILAPTKPGEGAWASTRKAGAYDITLRLYQPSQPAQQDFASIPLPRVTKLDCGEPA